MMRGIIVGFLVGAAAVTLVGCAVGGCEPGELRPFEDGIYRTVDGARVMPFHDDVPRTLELSGATLIIRWEEGGVETVETWRLGEVERRGG